MSDYGERLRKAKRDWDDEHDPDVLSWAEVARRAAILLGRRLHPETVLLMKAGRQEPTVAEFRALGEVLQREPAWLAFGRYPEKPPELQEPVTESYGEMTEDPRTVRKRRAK